MSKITTKIKAMWRRLESKAYRDAYVEEHINTSLASQIYAIRNQRGLTQTDLAAKCDMKQPRISIIESSCSSASLNTLKRLASAFDVALVVKFVPFSELVRETVVESVDREIPNFDADRNPIDEFTKNIEATPAKPGVAIYYATGAAGKSFIDSHVRASHSPTSVFDFGPTRLNMENLDA